MSQPNSEPKPILTIADWIKRVQELETTFQNPELWPWPFPDCDGPPNDLDLKEPKP